MSQPSPYWKSKKVLVSFLIQSNRAITNWFSAYISAVKIFQLDTPENAECVACDEHGPIVSLQAQLLGLRKVTKIFCAFIYKTNVHVTSHRAYLSIIKLKMDFT